jgi:glutathione S-transferase
MIKLYGLGLSFNISKVRYCLNYLNLQYDWVQTNPIAGENQTAEYLNLCPTGKIPAIDVDGFKLFESNAIIKYLATINNSPIYPQDAKKRAVIDAWMDYVAIHVGHAIGRVLFNRVFAPMTGQKADQESIRVGLEFLDKYFPILEKQLSQNAYLTGRELSIADISLLAALDPCELAQINSIDRYPSLKKWRAGLKAQSFYQKCYKDYTQFVQEMMNAKAGK